jgi:phthiodiolone/phenolphthiodiolone dimycocerosates ketoreductase
MGIKVGAMLNPVPPLELSVGLGFQAEATGYDSVWFPDHLMGWFPRALWTPEASSIVNLLPSPHLYLDPTVLIALVGQATQRVTLGTGVTDIIRRSPPEVARTFVTLSLATQGRAVLGLGAGERLNTEPYGLDYRRQVSRLEEALHIIRLLWGQPAGAPRGAPQGAGSKEAAPQGAGSKEPVSFVGRFWTLDRAVLDVDPYQGIAPPIWLGSHGPRMLRLAGRYADGWLPSYPMDAGEYAERLSVVRSAGREAGRDPASITAGYHAYVVPAEDHETSHRMLAAPLAAAMSLVASAANWERSGRRHPLGDGFQGLRDYVPEWYSPEELQAAVAAYHPDVLHDQVAHGTAAEIAAFFEPFVEAGLEHLVVSNVGPLAGIEYLGSSSAVLKEALALLQA